MSRFDGTIRPAAPADVSAITTIYDQAVEEQIVTCDLSDVAPEDRREWLERHAAPYGVWVAEDSTAVQRWYVLESYSAKPCFAKTATVSTYVRREARERGVGSALVAHTPAVARERGMHALVIRVWANNEPSIALWKRFGFQQVGHMPELVAIDGAFVDCLLFQLILD